MKKPIDIFSKQARTYRKYRPKYPLELYKEILQYVQGRDACWDCATGNGQVAAVLSGFFTQVYATDVSQKQIDQAEKRDNIIYKVERAERTNFDENQFDLITVGQAMHWFDMAEFNKEVYRVAKNGATVAVWCYGLLRINEAIDILLDEFCHETLGNYWNPERKHVDSAYRTIRFDFEELSEERERNICTHWNLSQLEGYLNSWSSVQHYIEQKNGVNPVSSFINKIDALWDPTNLAEVKFPIYLKVGRVQK